MKAMLSGFFLTLFCFLSLNLIFRGEAFAQPNATASSRIENTEQLETSLRQALAALPVPASLIPPFLPNGVKKLVEDNQPRSGNYLISLAINPQSELQKRAVGAFISCWKSMSAEQVTAYLRGAIELKAGTRPHYSIGYNAPLGFSYTVRYDGIPVGHGNLASENFSIKTRTTHFIDGKPWGEPYKFSSPWARTGWFYTKDLPLGEHYASLKLEFEWAYNGLSGKGEIESKRFPFRIVEANVPDDLTAVESDEARQLFKSAFVVTNPKLEPLIWRDEITLHRAGIQVFGPEWKLTRELPFALTFVVEIHDLTSGKVFAAPSIFVRAGKLYSGQILPHQEKEFAGDRTGKVPVKVVLRPSYPLALSEPEIASYFAEEITFDNLGIYIFRRSDASKTDPKVKEIPLKP